jgi:FkbM family methyltransferase
LVLSKVFKGNAIAFATDIDQYLNFNLYEDSFRKKYWNVKPNDIVMDIGVDFGPYTLTALSQGAEHVYVVEPRTRAIEKLKQNLRLNPAFTENVTIIKGAASDISYNDITIRDSNASSKESRFSNRFNETDEEEEVKTITIDDIVEKFSIKQLDWLKIDVEGMETKVLLGAENTLIHLKPKIILENHTKANETTNDRLLRGIGYQLIHRNNEVFHNLFNSYNSQCIYHHFWE